MTEYNMKIYTFNCKGLKNRYYPFIKELSNRFDFEIDGINNITPKIMIKATPSMEDTDIN